MNKNKILSFILIVIIVCVIIGININNSPRTPKYIKVGVIDVLSGDNASLGENFKKGIEIAKEEYINKNKGYKLDLIFEDDGYDKDKALTAFHKLINTDRVNAIIVVSTPAINAISLEASKLSIPIISYGSQKSDNVRGNIFNIFPDSSFADTALGIAMKALNASTTKDVIGVYTYDETLIKFYNSFKESIEANIDEFSLNPNMTDSDIKSIAIKIKDKSPKYVFMSNYPDLGARLIKEINFISKKDNKPTFVFDLTLNQSLGEYEKILGNLKSLDNSMVVSLKTVPPVTSNLSGMLTDYGYDAMNILLKTQSTKNNVWLDNIRNLKTVGVTGDISFDVIGRRIPSLSITNIKDGKIPEYK